MKNNNIKAPFRTQQNFFSPQRPNTTQHQYRNKKQGSPDLKNQLLQSDTVEKPMYQNLDKLLTSTKTYKTQSYFHKLKYENFPNIKNQKNLNQNKQMQLDFLQSNNNNTQQKQQKGQTKLSNVIYILGPLAQDLIYFIDNTTKIETSTNELIKKNITNEFLLVQKQRTTKIMNLYQKFFLENILNDKEKEGLKEIGQIMKREISTHFNFYERFIATIEENLKKLQLFQDKEIILVTDFYKGLKMLIDCYNYQYVELGSFGKTRPEQSAYIKSLYQFKSLLKSEKKNEHISKLYEDIEEIVKSQYEKIDNLKQKINDLEMQNKELTMMCQQLQLEKHEANVQNMKKEKEIAKQQHENLQNQMAFKGNSKFQQNINNQFSNSPINNNITNTQIMELKRENKRLQEALNKAVKRVTDYQNIDEETIIRRVKNVPVSNQQTQEEARKKLKEYTTTEKAVQCTYISEIEQLQKKQFNYSSILENPLFHVKGATLQSKNWLVQVVNCIMSEKIFSELYDEAELRPRQNLQNYISEWFLKKFGSKFMAEVMLKDFLFSLKYHGSKHDRLQLFSEFAGLEQFISDTKELQQIPKDQGINKQRFRQIFYQTNECFYIYMRIAYKVRNINNFYNSSYLLPVLSNIQVRCMDLVQNDQAKKIWESMINEDDLSLLLDESQQEISFKNCQSNDIQQRFTDTWGIYEGMEKDGENQYIRFDTFAKLVINGYIDQKFNELEEFLKKLKLKSHQKYENLVNFDDYQKMVAKVFPKKTQRWVEISYRYLIDAIVTDKTPLHVAIVNLTKIYLDDYNVKENFLKIKSQFLLRDDSKGGKNTVGKNNDSNTSKMKSGTKSIFNQAGTSKAGMDYKQMTEKLNEIQNEKDKVPQMYDHVNSIMLIEDSYKIVMSLISTLEKKNDNLQSLHEKFKDDFTSLPKNTSKMTKYEDIGEIDKKELMGQIQQTWTSFRKLLTYIIKQQ